MTSKKEIFVAWIFFLWYGLSLYIAYNAGAKKYWDGANENEFGILILLATIMFIFLAMNLDIKRKDE